MSDPFAHPPIEVPMMSGSFASVEEYVAHKVAVVEAFLTGRSLPFLKKLQSWADLGKLPLGLEKYRTEVLAFLSNAIAYAEDLLAIAEMLRQLGLVDAAAVASGVATVGESGLVTAAAPSA